MRTININISEEVFQKIEQKRGTRPHFRSGYIDRILRKELGIKQREDE